MLSLVIVLFIVKKLNVLSVYLFGLYIFVCFACIFAHLWHQFHSWDLYISVYLPIITSSVQDNSCLLPIAKNETVIGDWFFVIQFSILDVCLVVEVYIFVLFYLPGLMQD